MTAIAVAVSQNTVSHNAFVLPTAVFFMHFKRAFGDGVLYTRVK